VDLYDQRKPIDLVIVRDELTRRGVLDQIGGVEYLIDLSQSVPSAVNAEYYARIVRDKATLRKLITCAGQILEEAYADRDDAKEILDRAEQRLFAVTDQRIAQHATAIKDYLEEAFRQLETRDGHYITGLPTGFIELDDMTSGLQNGELIIVASRPSMGKTSFAFNVAQHLAVENRVPVAFFSMEQSIQQVALCMLCAQGRVDSHKLRRGLLSEREIMHLQIVCNDMRDMPLYVDDTPGMTVLELRAKARRLRARHEIAIVFVDYLQLMHAPGAENRQQEIAQISRGLKALARELNIPVVAMAQLNRSPEAREGNRPRMSDLRESGAIEQDADVVILLHREDYYRRGTAGYQPTNEAEVIVAKQRNGPTGTLKLRFFERLRRFDNLSAEPEPEPVDLAGPEDDTPF